MTFTLTLTITHPGLAKPITHNHKVEANSISQLYRTLDLTNKQMCELRNKAFTSWTDENGAHHKLELTHEAH